MKINYFIGVDVSKHVLDFALNRDGEVIYHLQVDNSEKGIGVFIKQAQQQYPDLTLTNSLFCMEHTGIYNYPSLTYFKKVKAIVWLESATHIKYSQGLQRGKNDKVDAYRISSYAYKNQADMRIWKPKREVLDRLHHLVSLRSRLINVKKQLKTPVKELKGFISNTNIKELVRLNAASIKALEQDISRVDKRIDLLIHEDEILNRLFNQVTSVRGIGPQTAVELILTTNEFKAINQARSLACHAGVAPFSYRSGKSVRGSDRVSHRANKNLKRLLHMGAITSIQCPGELQDYYKRKVDEGKNKMAVLNAVRNKMIHRVCAVVRDNRKYDNNYINALA